MVDKFRQNSGGTRYLCEGAQRLILGDIKMMQGSNPPGYRLRIGKYRVLYEYTNIEGEQVLMINDIGSRGNIYK